jgi:hypothetical protein
VTLTYSTLIRIQKSKELLQLEASNLVLRRFARSRSVQTQSVSLWKTRRFVAIEIWIRKNLQAGVDGEVRGSLRSAKEEGAFHSLLCFSISTHSVEEARRALAGFGEEYISCSTIAGGSFFTWRAFSRTRKESVCKCIHGHAIILRMSRKETLKR